MLHREYRDAFDLTGGDLISLLDHPKAEVTALIGTIDAKESMTVVDVPVELATSMKGDIADEVHEWPQVTLGPRFRHLVLQFLDDRLVGFRWRFPPSPARAPTPKPWYRRRIGRKAVEMGKGRHARPINCGHEGGICDFRHIIFLGATH